jgi:hypothetical protein
MKSDSKEAEVMMGTTANLTELLHDELARFASRNEIHVPFVIGALMYLTKRAIGQLEEGDDLGANVAAEIAVNLETYYEKFSGDGDAMRAAIKKETGHDN